MIRRWSVTATAWLAHRTWSYEWQARLVCAILNAWETITRTRPTWGVCDEETGVHIVPFNDQVEHDLDSIDCICGPDVDWINDDDGVAYDNGPLVTHHSLDGRENRELRPQRLKF